jgi:hypothetical protein
MSRNRKRRGRPSNLNVQRYPNGRTRPETWKAKGETEVQIMSTVLEYRKRALPKDMPDKDVRSAAAGYALGRLLLCGVVSGRRHRAGCDFAQLIDTYQRIKGYPSPFPKGMDIGAVRGIGLREEESPDVIRRVSNDYQRVTTALAVAGTAAMREVREVCIFDRDPVSVDNLKLGLDALADFFKIPADHVDPARKSV